MAATQWVITCVATAKKTGHLQKVCNSPIKTGAPEVDAQGKPYTHANELDKGDATDGARAAAGHPNNPWLQQPDPYDYGATEEVSWKPLHFI